MRTLIPRDHWEYGFVDLLRSMAAVTGSKCEEEGLHLRGIGKCLPLRSGRASLVTAIQALEIRPGAPVAVPLYCCPVVFKAIELVGCRPLFIDIDPETFCMSPDDLSAKRSLYEAVVAVHMFGNLCDIKGLKEASGGVPIIEDCAQALSSKLGGRPAGSFGDMAFFSFRSGKYVSAGEGGALFSNNSRLLSRAAELTSEWKSPTRAQELRHAWGVYIKSLLRRRPLYGVAGYRLWQSLDRRMRLSERSGVGLGRIHRTDLAVAKVRLASLDSSVARQRAHAAFLARALKPEPAAICMEKPGAFYNRFHFPLAFPSSDQRDLAVAHLLARGIDTIRYLNGLVETASRHHGYEGGCPVSEGMSERVLILPSYHALSAKDMEHIAAGANEALALIRSHSRNSMAARDRQA